MAKNDDKTTPGGAEQRGATRKKAPRRTKKAAEPPTPVKAGRLTFQGPKPRTDNRSGGGGQSGDRGQQTRSEFQRRQPERPENPRRVRGGIKLDAKAWPPDLSIFASPIIDLVDRLVPLQVREEAFIDYAQRGQTKTMTVVPGGVDATVQGRRYKAYNVAVRFKRYAHDDWDRLIAATDKAPLLPAKLLAGEMPPEVLAFAEGEGLPLHPTADEVSRTTDSKEGGDFDKHAACVLMLLAEQINRDPFALFTLRGLTREELAERLRQRRAVTSSSSGSAAAYAPQPPAETEAVEAPLDAMIERFYNAGPELNELELPLRKPDVSHPLLRRLGPSPFEQGKFPLVGLLATCYDTVSTAALRTPDDDAAAERDASRNGIARRDADAGAARGIVADADDGSGDRSQASVPKRVTKDDLARPAKAKAKARAIPKAKKKS